jgi:hypothetical protein
LLPDLHRERAFGQPASGRHRVAIGEAFEPVAAYDVIRLVELIEAIRSHRS